VRQVVPKVSACPNGTIRSTPRPPRASANSRSSSLAKPKWLNVWSCRFIAGTRSSSEPTSANGNAPAPIQRRGAAGTAASDIAVTELAGNSIAVMAPLAAIPYALTRFSTAMAASTCQPRWSTTSSSSSTNSARTSPVSAPTRKTVRGDEQAAWSNQ
jgi:hypothetical protein